MRRYPGPVTPEQLSDLIVASLADLSAEGAITLPGGVPATVTVERPRQKGHGDYATNVALQLAKKAGVAAARASPSCSPTRARRRRRHRRRRHRRARASSTSRSTPAPRARSPTTSSRRARRTAAPRRAGKQKVNLEFVSANPTGPLHLGQSPLGRGRRRPGPDCSRRPAPRSPGSTTSTTTAPRSTGSPLAARRRARPSRRPRTATAATTSPRSPRRSSPTHPEAPDLPDDEALEVFRPYGVGMMFDEIKPTLHDFGVDFDVYFHENALHESRRRRPGDSRGSRELGHIYEADGAIWLRTEEFGDDKDRVIVKCDGTAAYIAGDVAYYLDKRERGFDLCIFMLGADHHGYVGRLKAMCAAFGDDPGVNLEVLIGQMVNLVSDGAAGADVASGPAPSSPSTTWSTRSASTPPATRWSATRSTPPSTSTSTCGPGRPTTTRSSTCSTRTPGSRRPAQRRRPRARAAATTSTRPAHPRAEGDLLRALAEFPRVVARGGRAARAAPGRALPRGHCRVVPPVLRRLPGAAAGRRGADRPHRARLRLVDATRIVLANGLDLLGVTAPERM